MEPQKGHEKNKEQKQKHEVPGHGTPRKGLYSTVDGCEIHPTHRPSENLMSDSIPQRKY